MKRFAFIAMLLSLGFVAGCENKKPAATPKADTPAADAPDKTAPKDDAAAPEKPAGDKEDMPDDEKDK